MAVAPTSDFLKAAQTTPYLAPTATPPSTLFFTYKRADGGSFVASAAQAEGYLRKGYTVTGEQTVEDSIVWGQKVSPGSLEPPADGTAVTEATGTSGAKGSAPVAPPA